MLFACYLLDEEIMQYVSIRGCFSVRQLHLLVLERVWYSLRSQMSCLKINLSKVAYKDFQKCFDWLSKLIDCSDMTKQGLALQEQHFQARFSFVQSVNVHKGSPQTVKHSHKLIWYNREHTPSRLKTLYYLHLAMFVSGTGILWMIK